MTPSRPLRAAAVVIGVFLLVAFCGKRPEAADASPRTSASAANSLQPV